MEFTIAQLAGILNAELVGDGSLKVKNVGKIEEAKEGDVSFLANPKYESYIYTTNASAVIVSKDFTPKTPINSALIKVDDPYSSFTILLEEYDRIMSFAKKGDEQYYVAKESSQFGKDCYRGSFSYVGENCVIGNNVKIYPHVYVGDNCIIGDNTILYSGVKLYSQTQIGNNCTIHSGTVLGSDGFGFAPQADGSYKAIPQVGNVVLEDNVSIGANTVIDCATMGSTIIRKGVKLDNLIQIAHNCEIGENTVVAAQAGMAGTSKVGKNCVIGGQVGLGGHLTIADRTSFGAKAGIGKSVKEAGQAFMGAPAIPIKEFYKVYAIYKNLPEILKRIADLEEKTLNLVSN
jgi:UDP-3-O-[3-hydroxymyristoyl] glucosamine N-acyltransferase